MLEITDLLQRFGDVTAVDHISFGVREGEAVGLVGRNGAGKTTTMRAVMGILRPSGGAVRWEGHLVSAQDRLRFGYMPEERGLYAQMETLDQLVYFARLHGIDRATAGRDAKAWLARLGLETRANDRVVALSHGNQQRLQLAVALVHHPELLVLDEPFAGLDPSAVDALSDVMREEAKRGTAILFSSHQLDLVERVCDRVVIMEAGRILAAGTLDELRRRLPQELRVTVRGGAGGWATRLRGVSVLCDDDDGVLLRLAPGADSQTVLRRAMATGAVEHFGLEAADLPEIYRQLVAG